MTKPAMIHFISEIPEPAAYGAISLTRRAATNENDAYSPLPNQSSPDTQTVWLAWVGRGIERTHSENNIYDPSRRSDRAPRPPRSAALTINLPAAELLVKPPPIRAVPHLDIRQPLGDDRDESGVHADACALFPMINIRE